MNKYTCKGLYLLTHLPPRPPQKETSVNKGLERRISPQQSEKQQQQQQQEHFS